MNLTGWQGHSLRARGMAGLYLDDRGDSDAVPERG